MIPVTLIGSCVELQVGKNLENDTQTDKQIEMFKKSNFEIKTRKKTIEPRTNAQKAFISSLLK